MRTLRLSFVFLLGACNVSVPSVESGTFRCSTNDDCANDFHCDGTGECVANPGHTSGGTTGYSTTGGGTTGGTGGTSGGGTTGGSDLTPPVTLSVVFNSPTPNATNNSMSASFSVQSTDNGGSGIRSYLCSVDNGSLLPCPNVPSNPGTSVMVTYSFAAPGMADGSHSLTVRTVDNAGNTETGGFTLTWTVDATPPAANVVYSKLVTGNTATFTFVPQCNEANGCTYLCSFDGSAQGSCPTGNTYTLTGGSLHSFQVVATDSVGNRDPNPTTNYIYITPDVASAGGAHSCAVAGGNIFCWGANNTFQLGLGAGVNQDQPSRMQVGTNHGWAAVAAGGGHTCALQADATLWCWGANMQQQTGQFNGSSPVVTSPTQVGTAADWMMVATGQNHTCGITLSTGSLYCWGDNSFGQVGVGSFGNSYGAPQLVDGSIRYLKVVAGDTHTCGLRADGLMYCWGGNSDGQLGTGDRLNSASIGSGLMANVIDVGAGGRHTCAVNGSHNLYCWGDFFAGQTAQGTAVVGAPGLPPSGSPISAQSQTAIGPSMWARVATGRGIPARAAWTVRCGVSAITHRASWGRACRRLPTHSLASAARCRLPSRTPDTAAVFGRAATTPARNALWGRLLPRRSCVGAAPTRGRSATDRLGRLGWASLPLRLLAGLALGPRWPRAAIRLAD